jgi:transcriptional regulator with XRE-family HTH domain
MHDYDKQAGQLLRTLRRQRGLTLKQAASRLLTSAPVLSRKERGEESVARADIQLAIAAYQLDDWEAHTLWFSAGMIPEEIETNDRPVNLRVIASQLLMDVPFPACVVDALGFLVAWNQALEAVGSPGRTWAERVNTPIHIIDELFSPRLRQALSEDWGAYVQQALRAFYHKTLHLAPDQRFQRLMLDLHQRHGEDFAILWRHSQHVAGQPMTAAPGAENSLVVRQESALGVIDYLLLYSPVQLPKELELILYLPFGRESRQRYQQLAARWSGGALYFAPPA